MSRVIRLSDFLAQSSGEPAFLVEGVVHSTATVLYGGPKAGKSWLTVDLAAALLTGQEQWLGRKISPGPHVVAFATTDPGSDRETVDRLASRGLSEYPAYLVPFDRAAAREEGMPYYSRLADDLVEGGVTALFFDNVFSGIAGDTKEQKDASVLLDGLNRFILRGIAVIAVSHTGKGSADSPARTPIGSQAFSAWPRSLVRVEVVQGSATRRRLYVSGNQAAPETVEVAYEFCGGTCTVGTVGKVEREPRDRGAERRDKDAALAALLVAVPVAQGKSKAAAGRYLYGTVTAPEAKPTVKAWEQAITRLERGGRVRPLPGGGWTRGTAA